MKKVNYDTRPQAIEPVGDGSHLYNWAIEELQMTSPDNTEEYQSWWCRQTRIHGTLTEESITQTVINSLWGDGVEQKLLNDFQAAQLGILDESYTRPYMNFLAERKALKERIVEDFAAWKSAT